MTINETIAEVLRLDELSEDLSPAPWHVSGVDSQHVQDDADEATADAYCSNDATLIAYYRTAAPALAREVQRLQGEIERLRLEHAEERLVSCCDGHNLGYDAAYRAGQEAMRERCMGVCSELILRARVCAGDDEGLRDLRCLESHMLRAIRALEVSHD
jgi:flagellar biosynthesis/type III secretory pathway protein FliH